MDTVIFICLIFLLFITLSGGSNNYSATPDRSLENIENLIGKIKDIVLKPIIWIANELSKRNCKN